MGDTITIPKSILSDPDYLGGKFSRPAAWIDLLLLADDRGEVRASYSALAARWQWSVNRVKRFLIDLTNSGVVDTFHGTFHGKNTESLIFVYTGNYEGDGKNVERPEHFSPSSPCAPSSLSPAPPLSPTPLPPSSPFEAPGADRAHTRDHVRVEAQAQQGPQPPAPFPNPFILSSVERDWCHGDPARVVDCKRRHLAENLRVFAGEIGMAEDEQQAFLDWWCSPAVSNRTEIRAESDQYFNLRLRAEKWMSRKAEAEKKPASRFEKTVQLNQNFENLVNAIYHTDDRPADGTPDTPDEQ